MRNVISKKKSPLAKLYLLPPISKFLLALFLFLLICIVGFMVLKKQSETDLVQIKNTKEQLEKEVTTNSKSYGEMMYYSKNAKTARIQYETLLQQFPPASKVGDLLTDITKLGTQAGLKFVSFRPKAEMSEKYYASVPVEISVTGSFHQIAQFLSGVANLPGSVVVVNQFTLEHAKEGVGLTFNFVATLYHTLPNSAEVKV